MRRTPTWYRWRKAWPGGRQPRCRSTTTSSASTTATDAGVDVEASSSDAEAVADLEHLVEDRPGDRVGVGGGDLVEVGGEVLRRGFVDVGDPAVAQTDEG